MQYISRAELPIEKCFVELCMQISFHVNRTEGLPTQPKLGDKQNFEKFICIHCTRYHFPLEFTKKKKETRHYRNLGFEGEINIKTEMKSSLLCH